MIQPLAVQRSAAIDIIKLLSNASVVFLHVGIFYPLFGKQFPPSVSLVLSSVFRFGVVCFYLTSGYLLKDKFAAQGLAYLKRRITGIILPVILITLFIAAGKVAEPHGVAKLLTLRGLYDISLGTSLWFVYNLWIALVIFYVFRRHLKSARFGVALFTITVIITIVTVYIRKTAFPHNATFVGFTFYVWLGNYLWRRNIIARLQKSSTYVCFSLFFLALALSFFENRLLFPGAAAISTLKAGYQLYSVATFLTCLKLFGTSEGFDWVNEHIVTGIFFYHTLVIMFLLSVARKFQLRKTLPPLFHGHPVIFHLTAFGITYILSACVVWLLVKLKVGFLTRDDRVTVAFRNLWMNR